MHSDHCSLFCNLTLKWKDLKYNAAIPECFFIVWKDTWSPNTLLLISLYYLLGDNLCCYPTRKQNKYIAAKSSQEIQIKMVNHLCRNQEKLFSKVGF
jgi:hypothetical protein